MHAKPIAGAYRRTAVATPAKVYTDVVAAAVVQSDGSFTPNVRYFKVAAESQVVRYTLDGTTPTTTNGFRLLTGVAPTVFSLAEMRAAKFLEESAGGYVSTQPYSQ